MLKFIWKYSKANVILRFLSTLTATVQPFIFIIAMKLAIDGIANRMGIQYVLTVIVSAFLVGTISAIINAWINNSSSAKAQQEISRGIQGELLKKALTLDVACFDNAEYYDKYVRAMREAEGRAITVLNTLIDIISSIIALFMIVSLVISLNAIVILICLIILIINILLNFKRNKIVRSKDEEMLRPQREAEYAKRLFYEPQYVQEMHLGKLGGLMRKKFDNAKLKTLNVVKKYCGKFVLFDSAFNATGYALMSSVMVVAACQIIAGALSIGDFAAMLNSAEQLLQRMISLFGQIPKLSENSIYIEDLRAILDFESKISSENKKFEPINNENSIEFRNVSFTYPGKENPVLKNINIEIKHGKTTAIVGYNGVGKSTFVKLLLRFYDPNQGSVIFGNTDYKSLDPEGLREKFGVVFQNYKCYALSVAENVLLDDRMNEETEKKVISALQYSGIYEKIFSLKNGLNTNLSREFDTDGVPLSGGEEQKIAIARAVVEDKDILVLDEPSSALDPIAEYDINQKIISLSQNKTVILISHRLSTVKMADMIYMMDKGEIIESGTHNELMLLHGKYHEMFTKQAEKYITSED